MIPVDSLLYKIDQKLNKLSSNEHQNIPLEDKILALNEAQIKLIKQKIGNTSNISGLGLDSFKKRYEDLEIFVENYIKHPLDLKENDPKINQYNASLKGLIPEWMFYIDSYVLADKGRCKDRKITVNPDLTKHADIQTLLNNEHYKPSFEYQESFNTIASDEISIYTDGTFIPTKIYVSYLRYPKYIDKEGYIKLDGSPSINQDSEFEYYLEDELVDLAVEDLAMYTENIAATQSAQLRIQKNE